MMGLQATTGKRKLEEAAAAAPSDLTSPPAKSGRWEPDDCIARLRAVAVPGEAWRSTAAFLATADDLDDDDDFDDDLSSDDDRCPTQQPHANGYGPSEYTGKLSCVNGSYPTNLIVAGRGRNNRLSATPAR